MSEDKKATEKKVEEVDVVEVELNEDELDKASGGWPPVVRPVEKGGRQYPIVPEFDNQ